MTQTLNYKIIGDSAQVLEINLEPQRTLIGDGGSLLYLDEEISFQTLPDDGADLEMESSAEDDASEEDDDFELPLPDEPDDDKVPEFLGEDTEDKERDASLLEKLWFATKKVIKKVGKTEEPKEKEPEEDDLLADGALAALEEEPEEEAEEKMNWYITHFHNQSEYIRKIAFTTSNSGILVPIDLSELSGNALVIQTGVFLCARRGVRLEKYLDTDQSINFTKEKFYNLNLIKGEGTIFLQAEGHVIAKELDQDAIRVNLFSLFAFEPTLNLEMESVVKIQSMRFEDDTQFVRLSGSGKFWVQAANLQQLVYKISPFVFEESEENVDKDTEKRMLEEIAKNLDKEDRMDAED
ncbi:MAG: AIM24 family protein [Microscillaceae bacterium]|nr:AIM24 family protein [Microscillaceae bacterium]